MSAWIPCISLHQPWASLVAFGVKRYETRHWPPPARLIGERVAIHAAKRPVRGRELSNGLLRLCEDAFGERWWMETGGIPLGAFVCTVRVGPPRSTNAFQPIRFEDAVSGNYDADRWAWPMEDVVKLTTPIPAKGHQSLWRVPLADLQLAA